MFYILIYFFPEDKVWTVVQHNSTDLVRVQGSSPDKPFKANFDYGASSEQLKAIVSQSEYCQQSVSYKCKRSRLFNTWGASERTKFIVRALLIGFYTFKYCHIFLPCYPNSVQRGRIFSICYLFYLLSQQIHSIQMLPILSYLRCSWEILIDWYFMFTK